MYRNWHLRDCVWCENAGKNKIDVFHRDYRIEARGESPLQQAFDRAKAEAFMPVANLTQIAAGADPAIIHDINIAKAYRDAVTGSGAPADWLNPVEHAA